MTLFPVFKLVRSLGIKMDVKETSKKEKFRRKKYMGVLKWRSIRVSMMIVRFPKVLSK